MGPGKILIIDDDDDVLCACETVLSSSGYEIICAHTGEGGFAEALRLRPDLVILDIIMSPENGLEITERLKNDARTAEIPIIVISAVAEKLHKQVYSPEIAERLQAERFLQKPVDPQRLRTEVAAVLAKGV